MVSSNIPWIIEETLDWLTPDKTSGTADATVTLTYTENTTAIARDGTITLRNNDTEAVITHTINISQEGRTLSVSETTLNLPPTLGSTMLTVNANIPWIIEETLAWLTLSQTSGTADATVTLTYTENTTAAARDGIITLRSSDSGTPITHRINISQADPTSRFLLISPDRFVFPRTMGSTMLTVNTNIPWIIEETLDWVTPDQTSGTASAMVTLTYTENTTATARDGTITLRNNDTEAVITHTINISQEGRTLTVSETTLNLPSTLGSTPLTVNTNVPWIIEGTLAWLTLSQTSGTADATVTIDYEANPTATARDGTITLRSDDAGALITHTINISQAGQALRRVLRVNTNTVRLPFTSGNTSLTVTSTNVDWIVEENLAWLSTDPTEGTASETVRIFYVENEALDERSGTITLRSKDSDTSIPSIPVSVRQAGFSSTPVLGLPILEEEGIHIFPNPAGNLVYIEGIKGGGQVLTIRSLAGILLRSEALRGDERGASAIDISRFPRGVYIFTIRGPQGSVIRRLIKQ